jgi:hypothetical protein
MPKRLPRKSAKSNAHPTARTADRHELYLKSVQAPDYEVYFFDRVYRRAYGRLPMVLREDFCGTFAVCCEWVKRSPDRRAIGVDLDPHPLQWGRTHLLSKLTPQQQQRVTLLQANVLDRHGQKADVLAAQNFSWFIFQQRAQLLDYFKAAHHHLNKRGVFVLDMMGGPECMHENRIETRRLRGFKYLWEQERFDPITHHCRFHISFAFHDGTRMRRAFTYDWRLWTVPETRELLQDAGFKHIDVYWEGTDRRTGQGNHVYSRRTSAPSDRSWVAYVVAWK